MADRTQARVANHNDIASDDPFAELTRIMGFDPREPVQRQAQPAAEQAEDFDIDLEKELMGEFDAYQEEPVAVAQPLVAVPHLAAEPHVNEVADDDLTASMEREFYTAEAAVPAAAGPVEDDAPDFDFAVAAESMDGHAFDAAVAIDNEVPSETAPTGQQFEDYEAAMSDVDFGDLDFTDETVGEPVAAIEPVVAEHVATEPFAEAPVAFAVEPNAAPTDDDFDAHFDTAVSDVDMDFSMHDEASVVAATEVEVEPARSELSFMPTFGHHPQLEDVVAESEPNFAIDLDDAFNDESEAVAMASAEPEAIEPVATISEPVVEAASVAAQDRSLEDELNALLGRMTARPTAAPVAEAETWRPQFAAIPAAFEQPVPLEVEADLDAALVEEFAAADIEDTEQTPTAEDDIDFDTAAFDAAMAGGLDTLDEQSAEQVEEDPVEALKWAAPAAAAAAATATFAQPMRAWSRGNPIAPSSQPYSAPAQQYSASVQQFSAPTQLTPVQPAVPAEPDMAVPPQPAVQPAAQSWQKPAYQAAVREDVPDIETMDVPERVVALADDLDIPEVPFEQDKPEISNFDELDAEFSTLLNEMLPGESAAPAKTAHYDDDAANYKRDRVEMPAYADSPQAAASAAAYADLGYQGYDPRGAQRTTPAAGQIADDGFDYDPDLDEGMTIPDAAAAEANEAPRRRGLMIAALVGAVAVVGGIGAFAFSFGGGSSSEAPAIVKADNQPMKVKPENPGGTVIPNQDNKVYDAVAKGARPAVPTQPKLVANAEEPVDVVAKEQAEQAERTAAFAGTDDSEGNAQAQAAGTQQPVKSEDRVAQVAQENAGTQEGALVTPRKVRTMVVKPDGTLAPREEPVAAPVAASEPADPTPQRVGQDQTGTVPQAAGSTGTEQPVLKPAKPSTVAATPSAAPVAPQRPSDQPVDIAGEVKPQAQQQQVASAQPQAPAPAAGSWSMQIASQPTVEGAQSTYQDLARRYSNVLAGRSANIVKADVAGKGTFYRVRVMAQSREDAIKLCTSYKAAGGNCFVSK
ncbi:sporulation protein [Mesorhizobium loti]|nr:SPOR domain-containing protein [Mesorhizobium loti]PLP60934.1 sporulation protein [Mesorhizobium loti]